MSNLVRLGLTGGIGSGKSTVAKHLQDQGAWVIDADAVSRQLTATGGAAIADLADEFGPEVITPQGALDRMKMRALAFADPMKRSQLEAVLHPLIAIEIEKKISIGCQQGYALIVLDIPLLVESGRWRHAVDRVLVIHCDAEVQIERVMQRSGLTRLEVQGILAAQASAEQRLQVADLVIDNTALSLDALSVLCLEVGQKFGLSSLSPERLHRN